MKVLNNNNKILDSQETEKMIKRGEIIDLSEITEDKAINYYIIESSTNGCEFNLISKSEIKEEKQDIILNFKDDNNNNVNSICIISNENNNTIPCSLEKDVNQNFILDSYIGSNDKGFFSIIQENNTQTFKLICKKMKKKESSKIPIIILIIIVIMIILILIISTYRYKKKTKKVLSTYKRYKRDFLTPKSDDSNSEKRKVIIAL